MGETHRWILSLLCLLWSVHGDPIFTNQTVPLDLSNSCTNALLQDIECGAIVPRLQADSFYDQSTLERACGSTCSNSINNYHSNVVRSCLQETWSSSNGEPEPVPAIIDRMRFNYNLICMKDGSRFCNVVAASIADKIESQTSTLANTDSCDLCLIKSVQYRAGSPFSDGPVIRKSSVYHSLTSRCGITGMPATSTSLDYSLYVLRSALKENLLTSLYRNPTDTTSEPVPTSTCSSLEYEIRAGDDCHKISIEQGIGTAWLLSDNGLSAGCDNFPLTGKLCLANACNVYTVKTGDTCASIASSHDINEVQLRSFNPIISPGCYNLATMVGSQICVSVPGRPYISPSSSMTLAPITPTVPAPVPTDIAQGTNINCGQFYKAGMGDYCNLLLLKFGISLPDFIFLNTAVNENCTNLFADESYCVQAVGDSKYQLEAATRSVSNLM